MILRKVWTEAKSELEAGTKMRGEGQWVTKGQKMKVKLEERVMKEVEARDALRLSCLFVLIWSL